MNISIFVPDEVEAALRRKAATFGQDLGEFLQRVMVAEVEQELPTPPCGESTDAFMTRLREMTRRHAVCSGHVDVSRESIYAGRGK